MNPWAVNPAWQNFSSLFREAVAAREAKTEMERFHHLTASLYFGIASLEAFLNEKMRVHLNSLGEQEHEIFSRLRKGRIVDKLKEWPGELLGKSSGLNEDALNLLGLNEGTLNLLGDFNDIRGNLTHPKTQGRDIYAKLETIKPDSVVDAVAEYIVRYHEAEKTQYPYWIFGWNYLNPRQNSCEILLFNNQQFCWSMRGLGSQLDDSSQDRHLRTFKGYIDLKEALNELDRCEPKFDRFPLKPILCRRWWTSEHQQSCGHVTEESLNFARDYGSEAQE
jgi:hypothetical protein